MAAGNGVTNGGLRRAERRDRDTGWEAWPAMSGFAAEVANRLRDELVVYGRKSWRGRPRGGMAFKLPNGGTARTICPAVAFVSFDRWPEDKPLPYRAGPVDVVPELVVEVATPHDPAEDLLERCFDALKAGAELVWVVYPRLRQVHAYGHNGHLRVFTESDTLDGGDVLPEFAIPLVGLFPPVDLPEG